MKIVFMGTPDFAVGILDRLAKSENEIGYVITQPDKAKDRGKKVQPTPVKEKAFEYGLTVLQPERVRGNEELMNTLKKYAPDLMIVAAYGQILPKEVLEIPRLGCINVHASLLPKLRGAAPIQQAIVTGEKETGVTIMQMAEGLDTGDMLAKASMEIGRMNSSRLHDALSDLGAELLLETLPLIEKGRIKAEPQDDSLSTYAGMISKKDGAVDFSKSPEEVERLIRGFDPWPGAYCMYKDQAMKLWAADPLEEKTDAQGGTVIQADEKGIKAACGGRVLLIKEIQMPGKKRVKAGDFLRGNSIEKGTVLK